MELKSNQGGAPDTVDLEIRCPIETRVLSLLRCIVTSMSEQAGFSDEEIGEIEMAVDEACTNVVRHAYKHLGLSPDFEEAPENFHAPRLPNGDNGENGDQKNCCVLKMRITLGDQMIRFRIIDHGQGMDPGPHGVHDVEEYVAKEGRGGLGSLIIRNFMDEVKYDFPAGKGTVLTMTKYVRAAEAEA
ncbi:ATP-binding protein [bacterium]|nr:ATP-binding protein [bacterium]